ncbi:AmmeMemoRadiSam system protein B [Desulfobacterota bacterium AH_259_B03_O07]|nr:AmmeMemoRadiSam system protein B [Desulfobacterota bacterium AH_259_B03_O07]
MVNTKNITRSPAVAGAFYPADKVELQNMIFNMLDVSSSEQIDDHIIGLISPHAGYVYSGKIAAEAYKQIQISKYDNVIVIAPSHFEYFQGCSIYYGNYQTPLGIVETNVDMAEEIVGNSQTITESSKGHMGEHSLEVQLPFLQITLENFKLIPVVIGNQDYSTAIELSNVICEVLSRSEYETLIIGSSDLSHYYPIDTAKEMDGFIIKAIEGFNEKQLFDDISLKKCEACGFGPMISTMMIAKKLGANHSKNLSYGTSGDTSGDYGSVVGYLSSAFYKV